MRYFCALVAFLCVVHAADAAPRHSSRAKVVAEYRALQYKEGCAWRRVIQEPAYAVPMVGQFAFVIAWDCTIRDAQEATRRRVEFGVKHGIIRPDPPAPDTAWYPAGFRF